MRALNRRGVIGLLGSAAAWPLAARAQQTGRSRRIGVLVGYSQDDLQTKERLVAFRQELERRGWLEGRNLIVDYRYAPAARQVQIMAKELLEYGG
jgi:DNA-binding LacI/PurR family transcriptional regulator